MPRQRDPRLEAIDRVMALGSYLLTAACRDEKTAFKILSALPYVKVNPSGWDVRSGTGAYVISNSILKDGTVGYSIVTGGALTPAEATKAMAALTEYGEEQLFAGPGIIEANFSSSGSDAAGPIKGVILLLSVIGLATYICYYLFWVFEISWWTVGVVFIAVLFVWMFVDLAGD